MKLEIFLRGFLSAYHTMMMHIVRLFSVIFMLYAVIFTAIYCLNLFIDKWDYPPKTLLIIAAMASAAVIMWKFSSFELRRIKNRKSEK